jgi:uncharacterized protein
VRRDMRVLRLLQGAQAGNRYFEHGTFTATETAYCRNTRQALVRAAATHLNTERR